jgi:tetratricopeptide (TPR) repeat protein
MESIVKKISLKKETKFSLNLALFFVCLLSLTVSCSSSPKRAMLVTDTSDSAATFYDTANSELVSGQLENAGGHLQQAYNLAMSVDDCDLLCRISLSAVIYKLNYRAGDVFNLDPVTKLAKDVDNVTADTPFYGLSAHDLLNLARSYSTRSKNPQMFKAVCSLYDTTIKLSEGEKLEVNTVISQMYSDQKYFSKEPYYLAYMYRTGGNVYASGKNYEKARELFLKAAQIHLKERYLNEIGLDYYSAARMSSLAGNKKTALSEIDIALKYDKDAENTVAIAADYFAYGLILVKGGYTEEEKLKAKNSMLWASKIYEAGGYTEDALNVKNAAEAL